MLPLCTCVLALCLWLEGFLLQTNLLQSKKKMLRFLESRRDSKKDHSSWWLGCSFGEGEPWVWVLAVRMHNTEMVWEQWLELRHSFLRCLYCWVIGSCLPSFFGSNSVWPSGSAPVRRSQADPFTQKPVILVGNLSGKQRCLSEPSQVEVGIKPRSAPRWASALAVDKWVNFCPSEGKLLSLLWF